MEDYVSSKYFLILKFHFTNNKIFDVSMEILIAMFVILQECVQLMRLIIIMLMATAPFVLMELLTAMPAIILVLALLAKEITL